LFVFVCCPISKEEIESIHPLNLEPGLISKQFFLVIHFDSDSGQIKFLLACCFLSS
jgi:hypothetical protein